MSKGECPCGGEDCEGVNDGWRHQCGGPAEACCVPGCQECGARGHADWITDLVREKVLAARREGFAIAREHAWVSTDNGWGPTAPHIDWEAAEKELTKREQAKVSGS